jgi:hypothetical protein
LKEISIITLEKNYDKISKIRKTEVYRVKKKNRGEFCLLQGELLGYKYGLNLSSYSIKEERNKWKEKNLTRYKQLHPPRPKKKKQSTKSLKVRNRRKFEETDCLTESEDLSVALEELNANTFRQTGDKGNF